MAKKSKKKLTDVGKTAPSNFKFGLIVTVAIFWTEFLKNLISYLIDNYTSFKSPILTSLIVAILFTVLAYFTLYYYAKIRNKLKKVKVK